MISIGRPQPGGAADRGHLPCRRHAQSRAAFPTGWRALGTGEIRVGHPSGTLSLDADRKRHAGRHGAREAWRGLIARRAACSRAMSFVPAVTRRLTIMERPENPFPSCFMRGGTSRGPYMRRADLPPDEETLSRVTDLDDRGWASAQHRRAWRRQSGGHENGDAVGIRRRLGRDRTISSPRSPSTGHWSITPPPAATSCPASAPPRWSLD